MKTRLTESIIQKSLFIHFSSHKYRFLNTTMFPTNENADFISFTESGYCQEVEIKISRGDFFHDFKKPKHEIFNSDEIKHVANRFYYAVPTGMVTINEVPSYAGLIYIDEYTGVEIIKKAPLMHKLKYAPSRLFNKMYSSYEGTIARKLRGDSYRFNEYRFNPPFILKNETITDSFGIEVAKFADELQAELYLKYLNL